MIIMKKLCQKPAFDHGMLHLHGNIHQIDHSGKY